MIIAVPIRKKFRKNEYISSAAWLFPDNAEREYVLFIRKYVDSMKNIFVRVKPQIEGYMAQIKSTRLDAGETELNDELESLLAEIVSILGAALIANELTRLAGIVRSTNENQLKKSFKKTLGIDIYTAYPELQGLIDLWIAENVKQITKLGPEYFDRISGTIRRGAMDGLLYSDIADELEADLSTTRSHAEMIARDQTAKLNGDITRYMQTDAGIEEYEWQDSGDERVRMTHAAHDGKIFKWSEPPADTGHPGQDYQCRCVALPVFQIDKLNIEGVTMI